MSNNKIDSPYTIDTTSELSIDKHLTKDEKNLLNNLNQTANTLKEKEKQNFFDKSLNSMLKQWSNIMSGIFHDFSTLIYINKYIKISNNLYEFTTYIFKDIWFIITKEERLIYVGFTFIFISFIIYFINVSN
jgi:hypothetical protein